MRYKSDMRALWLLSILATGCECSATGAACASSSDCTRGQMCIRGACYDEGQDAGRIVRPDSSVVPGFDGGSCATASDAVASLPVDIIIAVDQSASTGEERDAISQNINTNLV